MSISLHIQRVRTQRDLSGALKHFAQTGTDFSPSPAENTKLFWHVNNQNSGSKHDS